MRMMTDGILNSEIYMHLHILSTFEVLVSVQLFKILFRFDANRDFFVISKMISTGPTRQLPQRPKARVQFRWTAGLGECACRLRLHVRRVEIARIAIINTAALDKTCEF